MSKVYLKTRKKKREVKKEEKLAKKCWRRINCEVSLTKW